jgi:hypothetical protein
MKDFDNLSVECWHENGIIIPVAPRKAGARALRKVSQRINVFLSAVNVGIALSFPPIPTSSAAAFTLPTAKQQNLSGEARSRDDVPEGYWGDLRTLMKYLPRLPEQTEEPSIEPYI